MASSHSIPDSHAFFGSKSRWSLYVTAVLLSTPIARAQATTAPATPQTVPGETSANSVTKHTETIVLIVDKSNLRADLKTYPEDPTQATTLRTFRIAIGKEEGDKQIEGDNRTPEGIYFAQSHIDGSELPEKYGKMAIPIDYPNPMDHISRKTGHGIWLHGVERDQRVEEAKVTEGCVAFYNSDIARLSSWIRSHQGVVVIASDVSKVNDAIDVAAVRQATTEWMNAWAERRIDDYTSHYAADFRFERHDLESYKKYKQRVFAGYKEMEVKFDNLRVIAHPKYAVSFFNQDFHGDKHFASIGRKVLYWEKSAEGSWMIKREIYENRRFDPVTFTDEELALLSDSASSISSDKEPKAPNL